jgi:hypothetical protein
MVTVFEECTTEEQRSVVLFVGKKDPMEWIFKKKYFLLTVGSVLRVMRFHHGGNIYLMTKRLKRRCGSG